jgi:hypothetical protein
MVAEIDAILATAARIVDRDHSRVGPRPEHSVYTG